MEAQVRHFSEAHSSDPVITLFARPARQLSLADSLRAGWQRQRPAIIGALIAAWTGLPFALWIAVGGALAGALAGGVGAGTIGGHVESTLGIATGAGVLGALLGTVLGAVGGLLLVYIYLITHPLQLVGALLSGAFVTALVITAMLHAEPWLMRLRAYREPSRRERAKLEPLLLDTGRRMGLATVPAIWISDQRKPGAWAHTRGIVVTTGLLGDYSASEAPPQSELDDTALSAILAHELQHWDSGDVVGANIVIAAFYPFVLIVNAVARVREKSALLGVLMWCLLWPAWVTSKFVIVPLMARTSRRCELEADARAAGLGEHYRLGMRRALDELAVWERPRTGWDDVLAATHPPIEHRMELLESRA